MALIEVKHAIKTYATGEAAFNALNDVSLSIEKGEFVAIMGASGSGKSTFMNMLGTLDKPNSGSYHLDGIDVLNLDSDSLSEIRNTKLGFVFQGFNLISRTSAIDNVELPMIYKGIDEETRHQRAKEALKIVGLEKRENHMPNQMSGGQQQRVAIARAIVNDAPLILADEPTGNLDTKTSIEVMEFFCKLNEVHGKTIVLVTHEPDIAEYCKRIVKFKDGNIISDSNPYDEKNGEKSGFKLKKTSMSFATALKLSFTNIKTKKGRTALTAFASSIGIIGIATIMSLSSGFQEQINKFQSDSFASFPIMITQETNEIDIDKISEMQKEMLGITENEKSYSDAKEVYSYSTDEYVMTHKNVFTEEYIDYIENINPEYVQSIGYTRITGMNLLMEQHGEVVPVNAKDINFVSYPKTLTEDRQGYLEENYDLLIGEYPQSANEIVLVIDDKNQVQDTILKAIGYDQQTISFDDILGLELKAILNNDYYSATDMGIYTMNTNYEEMYSSNNAIDLKVVGIIRGKKDAGLAMLMPGFAYSDELSEIIIKDSMNSDIVKAQKEADFNVLTFEKIDETTKEQLIAYLGGNSTPYVISIFPTSFDNKDFVVEYLDEYNEGKEVADQIVYTDLADTIMSMTNGIMTGITVVLIAFAGISLVVSLIMIGIITYTSVLERTKEIGILKALGASKKDITRVFDAETCILGVFSGGLGIAIAYGLTFPINSVIYKMTDLKNVAQLPAIYAIMLIIISTILTMLGGHIPAKMASKKDAVEALRSE